MIQRLIRFSVTFLRAILRIFLVAVSLSALLVGLLGRLRIVSNAPQFLLGLAFPLTDLRAIRDDITDALRAGGRAAVEQHGIDGYAKKLMIEDIQGTTESAVAANQKVFEAGEFGTSWLITTVAILAVNQSWGSVWSYALASLTIVLIVAVAVRTALMNELAYDDVPQGETGTLLAVWFWNDRVLGGGQPLLILSVFQFARRVDERFYNLCLDALSRSAELSVLNPDKGMISLFYKELIPEFREYISSI